MRLTDKRLTTLRYDCGFVQRNDRKTEKLEGKRKTKNLICFCTVDLMSI